MPVISVNVDEQTASQIKPFVVVEYQELENIVHKTTINEDDEENWETVVDFWKEGVTAEEILSYIKSKK